MKALRRSWPRLFTAFGLVAGLLAMHAPSTPHPVDTEPAPVASTSGTPGESDADSSERTPISPSAIHIVGLCAAIVATLSAVYRVRQWSAARVRAARASLHKPLQPRSLVARARSPRLLCVQRC